MLIKNSSFSFLPSNDTLVTNFLFNLVSKKCFSIFKAQIEKYRISDIAKQKNLRDRCTRKVGLFSNAKTPFRIQSQNRILYSIQKSLKLKWSAKLRNKRECFACKFSKI